MNGWRAHIIDEYIPRQKRLILVRDITPERYEVLMPDGIIMGIASDVTPPADVGILLPHGAWEAICDLAAPSVSAGEIGRLTDALTVERARVDRVLDRLVQP